ncbi:hypothetical protein KDY119_03364 [Luteimicrobium xylanilyticum]|uniref:Peptidase inhibitor family I36 n=1 Tax=Luteimicrobium xylanilyticum TaxID=1133546 RepID=A0A5P9QEC3_9MICO|nr:hypothetical protein [Luteimicrobium xylanilyticum]QFU99828.1 hypothetical protein KDY119_03364 [Luteimicrobium xylanilyticum]
MKRTILAVIFGVATTIGAVGLSASAAGAATAPSGYMCGYEDQTYAGHDYCVSLDTVHWAAFPNTASSAAANGKNCSWSRYWSGWGRLTQAPAGDHFTLYSEVKVGENYRDPNLSNGAGFDGAGINFNDTIESSEFLKCA